MLLYAGGSIMFGSW